MSDFVVTRVDHPPAVVTLLAWLVGITAQLGVTAAALLLAAWKLEDAPGVALALVVLSLGVGAGAAFGVQRLVARALMAGGRALSHREPPIPEVRVVHDTPRATR